MLNYNSFSFIGTFETPYITLIYMQDSSMLKYDSAVHHAPFFAMAVFIDLLPVYTQSDHEGQHLYIPAAFQDQIPHA